MCSGWWEGGGGSQLRWGTDGFLTDSWSSGVGEAVGPRGWKENANRCEHSDWLAFFDAECLGFFFDFPSCIQKYLILLFGLMSILFRILGKLYN